jgi:molybdopterin adenylyltransferase
LFPLDYRWFAGLLKLFSESLFAAAGGSSYPMARQMQIFTGIITVSDRASRGEYDDLGGPALKKAVESNGWQVLAEALVPDEKREIQRAIREQIGKGCQLILTTGGTGVALRDITPEAVREIAVRELPGFGEAMRRESIRITPNAILSRNLAVVVERALVICLPGKPSGAVECLSFVAGAIPHCLEVLQEVPTSC